MKKIILFFLIAMFSFGSVFSYECGQDIKCDQKFTDKISGRTFDSLDEATQASLNEKKSMVLLGENGNSASITDPEDDSISAEEVEKRLNALICDFSNSGANPIKCLNETINKGSNELTINTGGDLIISGGFAEVIKKWTKNISIYLGTFAVFGIVYGGFSLTISAGEDEKVTKAKNILKWAIIGFLLIITTSLIINLIVNLMYSLGS